MAFLLRLMILKRNCAATWTSIEGNKALLSNFPIFPLFCYKLQCTHAYVSFISASSCQVPTHQGFLIGLIRVHHVYVQTWEQKKKKTVVRKSQVQWLSHCSLQCNQNIRTTIIQRKRPDSVNVTLETMQDNTHCSTRCKAVHTV